MLVHPQDHSLREPRMAKIPKKCQEFALLGLVVLRKTDQRCSEILEVLKGIGSSDPPGQRGWFWGPWLFTGFMGFCLGGSELHL